MHWATVPISPGYVFSVKNNGKKELVVVGMVLVLMLIIIRKTGCNHQ